MFVKRGSSALHSGWQTIFCKQHGLSKGSKILRMRNSWSWLHNSQECKCRNVEQLGLIDGCVVLLPCTDMSCVFVHCVRLRDDLTKEMGFVERKLSNYTGNQWREFFHMLPSMAESLLREIAPFLPDAENREDMRNIYGSYVCVQVVKLVRTMPAIIPVSFRWRKGNSSIAQAAAHDSAFCCA